MKTDKPLIGAGIFAAFVASLCCIMLISFCFLQRVWRFRRALNLWSCFRFRSSFPKRGLQELFSRSPSLSCSCRYDSQSDRSRSL